MHILAIVLQSWLLLYIGYEGVSKIAGAKLQVELFERIRLPQWFRVVTGIVQSIGSAGLIVGFWYPWVAAWAGVWLGITMALACLSHFRVKEPASKALPAFICLVLAAAVVLLYADELSRPFT